MVDVFLKRVEIKGALMILIAGALAFLLWDMMAPLSLILGGVLGLINLRWISKTIRGILGGRNPGGAKRALAFSYIFKLGILGLLLIAVLKNRAFNPMAFLSGFTLIIMVIILEGVISARKV